MLFTSVVAVMPISASAAHSESSVSAGVSIPAGYEEANLNKEELEAYMEEYLSYSFESASDMLNYELQRGLLYYANSPAKAYTIFVNKYTGFVYYVNNTTGQILTSNPINPASVYALEDRQKLMSQIVLQYAEVENTQNGGTYDSVKWAANRAQISVSAISGGLRVNYTLGDTAARFLLPGMATAEKFEESILLPMINQFVTLLEEHCTEEHPDTNFSFTDNSKYAAYEYGYISSSALKKYLRDMQDNYKHLKRTSAEYKQIDTLRSDIISLIGKYTLNNPAEYLEDTRYQDRLDTMYKDYPITKEGIAIYAYTGSSLPEAKRPMEKIIKKYCKDYTFAEMYAQEDECGYVDKSEQKPVFRCALEYTFNSDGSLSVRLPASSITFDETVYILDQITPLQYFGGADMNYDGYVFYPDGSGTVIDFSDFYSDTKTVGIVLNAPMYGIDYCYSAIDSIAGISHRAQVTMPVYGISNEVKASAATTLLTGKETVTNGYFAIIEEGSSLANLMVASGGSAHSYIGAYAYYTPYPSDVYDLSETLSVGSLGQYKIVSKSKYTGSYVTRFVMLDDVDVANACNALYGSYSYYSSDYVGMATYYREYLKNNGVLEALENLNEDLPLYIEVLGAMDITSKFLSFPVTETIPLTTFEDVSTIYEQLSQCEDFVVKMVAEYKELARRETDDVQKYQYEKQAERYSELIGKIQNIKNINFKLTGFANGGMSATYPAKLKWVKACGGASGFKSLVADALEISKTENYNFSVYPEFDFMYINNTAMFDGVDTDDMTSAMVDNRYASKQRYNAVTQEYEVLSNIISLVVSPDALAGMYSKFQKSYSSYNNNNISVSTIGSTLNSNFDKKNSINRDEAMTMVESVLDTMANKNDYSVMIDTGNIYAVEYAEHILNAPIDSSHHRYTSYTIPFVGLVLHSYVNYAGTPINYSGSPAYDRLRAIESGAALYYIVCFQNTSYLKDDEELSKYFGVDYHNWFDDMVENYKLLNDYIGDLQYYEIVDHKILIAEREIEDREMAQKYLELETILLAYIEDQIIDTVDAKLAELKGDPANYGKRIKLTVDKAELLLTLADILQLSVEDFKVAPNETTASFETRVSKLVDEYAAIYAGADNEADTVEVAFNFSVFEMALSLLDTQLSETVAAGLKVLGGASEANEDKILLTVDRDAVANRFAKILGVTLEEFEATYGAAFDALITEYETKYDGFHNEAGELVTASSQAVSLKSFVYTTDVYITSSLALDKDYIFTDYTIDNGNVTMVTYKKGDSTVRFILNYNNYSVTVRLSETEVFELSAYGCERIDD